MFERGRKASAQVQHHVDRCLSCLSCMTTCPSGVDYMHLVDHARAHIEETGSAASSTARIRSLLAAIVPYPDRFRLALRGARLARPLAGVFKTVGLPQLAAMMELAPDRLMMPSASYAGPGTAATKGERRKRVILLAGCAQQVLRPEINDATIRLLARRGVDVEVAPGAGCCGALVHHMGREAAAVAMAKRNVDAWMRLIDKSGPVDAVVVNTSGCGTTVKDYGHMLKRDSQVRRAGGQARRHHPRRHRVPRPPTRWDRPSAGRRCASPITRPARCSTASASSTIRASCCATRGSRSWRFPRATSAAARPAPTTSCSRRLPVELRERKVANIRSVRPDVVATGNIGCISQLAIGMDIPIAHTVELLDWAYGGPVPRGLEGAVPPRQGRARAQAGVCRHLRRPRALDSVAAPLTPEKACNPKVGRSWWRIGGGGRVDACRKSRGRRIGRRCSAVGGAAGERPAQGVRDACGR